MLRSLLIFVIVCAPPIACAPTRSLPRDDITIERLTIRSRAGEAFAARVYNPPASSRSGLGVLLIGGGLGNDLDWTVPGRIDAPGGGQRVTISGESHRDGPRIARALAQRGYVVMHWSTIAEGDPLAGEYPLRMTPRSADELLALARVALSAFRARGGFDPWRVVLVGHSMGGQRAAVIAEEDDGICALVLLASAQATWAGPGDKGRDIHRGAAGEFISASDADRDGVVDEVEFTQHVSSGGLPAPLAETPFADMDIDADGVLRQWELSGTLAIHARASADLPRPPTDGSGVAWTEDAIAEIARRRSLPILFIYGSLDNAQGRHAPVLRQLIGDGTLRDAELRIVPGVGHTLGIEHDGLIGPIDGRVLDVVAEFLLNLG